MKILNENMKILYINYENHYIESNFVNCFGNRVKIPARAIMFSEVTNSEGNPIYEFVSLDYVKKENEFYVSNEKMEKEIELREKTYLIPNKQSRVFHICQFFRNPKTGEPYFCDEEFFKQTLKTWSSILGAEILHDNDPYTIYDEEEEVKKLREKFKRISNSEEGMEEYINEHQWVFSGNQKPRHVHIPIAGKRGQDGKRLPLRLSTICKKFNIPHTCIQIVHDNTSRGGNDGFLDQILYLTHEKESEQEKGKTQYDRSRIFSNFDWEQALEERELDNIKYGIENASLWQKWQHDVLLEGKTLKECKIENWELYGQKKERLEKLRQDYLLNESPMPVIRFNYYIEAINAQGGEGKTQCAKCFARMLAHDEYGANLDVPFEKLNDLIYMVSDPKVSLQHYDGQPIIIFNDCKAGDMLTAFKSRDALKNFLEPFPVKSQNDIKYGDVSIVAKYVIINGIQSYDEFIEDLASTKIGNDSVEERQLNQFNRRFFARMIIDSTKDALKLLVNSEYCDNTPEREGFIELRNFRINFKKMLRQFDENNERKIEIEKRVFSSIIDKSKSYEENQSNKINMVDEEFALYGEEIPKWEKLTFDEILEEAKKWHYKTTITCRSIELDLSFDDSEKYNLYDVFDTIIENEELKDYRKEVVSFIKEKEICNYLPSSDKAELTVDEVNREINILTTDEALIIDMIYSKEELEDLQIQTNEISDDLLEFV